MTGKSNRIRRNRAVYLISGLVVLSLLTFSCKKQTAQYPSNKANLADSTGTALIDYNQELTQQEDKAIMEWISSQSADFKKSESGVWVHIQTATSQPLLANDSSCVISYRVFSTSGEPFFQEENKRVRFGKKDVPTGLEAGLLLLRRGEQATVVVPSYLAYGAQGTDIVPPYTPVIYIVESQ